MADEDIGGIKIGLTADIGQLKAAMDEADRYISKKAQNLRDRQITMHVFAKVDKDTFGAIERDLNLVVKRAQERNTFKFTPVFEINQATIRLGQRQLRQQAKQAGGIKIPVIPEFDPALIREALRGKPVPVSVVGEWQGWAADRMPEDFVLVKGIWNGWRDGPPDVDMGGGSGPGPGSGPAPRKPKGGNVKPPPDTQADVKPMAEATGKEVASEIKQSPVRTEKTVKEKTEEKARPAATTVPKAATPAPAPAAAERPFKSVDEYIATPANQEAIRTGRATEEMLRRIYEKSNAQSARQRPVQATPPVTGAAASRPATGGERTEDNLNLISALKSLQDPAFLRRYGIRGAPTAADAPKLKAALRKVVEAGRGKAGPGSLLEARSVYRAMDAGQIGDITDVAKQLEIAQQRFYGRSDVPSTASARDASELAEMVEENKAIAAMPAYGPEDAEPLTAAEEQELRELRLDRAQRYLEERRARVPKPPKAAKPVAAKPATDRDFEAEIKATEKAQDDALDVVLSNIEAQALRLEETPGISPRPEVGADQTLCPWCQQPYKTRGLASHIRQSHQNETQGLTPGGYSREELARARENLSSGGIGEVTPESTLVRRMAEERRETGVYDVGPDIERLIGTVARDKYGRAKMNPMGRPIREGGLLRKGLDPTAMRVGLLQPMQDLPDEKKQALLQDPDFIALRTEFYEAIEVRRAGLRGALAEELQKVADDPERSDRYLKTLQEAIEDPTAGMAHQIARRIARQERREELGISSDALTGFSRRDLMAAARVDDGPRPEGFEELRQTYLDAELDRQAKEAADLKELDAALLKHRTGEPGARQWDFGPDIEELRALRKRALEMPGPQDFEGWLSHAVGRGADIAGINALREEVEATPVGTGERGEKQADIIEELRERFGGPDLGLLEEVQRLATGPRFGEDISGLEVGDPRRTGLGARIRRSIVRGSRSQEAARLRLGALTDPAQRRMLRDIKPREMELLEVAGIAAEAAALLDISDVARNQTQSTTQAAETREARAAAGRGAATPKPRRRRLRGAEAIAEEEAMRARIEERKAGGIDPAINEARQREAVEQAQRETERLARAAEAAAASDAAAVDMGEVEVLDASLIEGPSAEDVAALKLAEELQPANCPCGWSGARGQFEWHTKGDRHKRWLAVMNPGAGPRAFAGPYNPDALIGATPPNEPWSQRIQRMVEAPQADRPVAATPAEEPWQPAWLRRESSKDLTRYASGGGPEGIEGNRPDLSVTEIAEIFAELSKGPLSKDQKVAKGAAKGMEFAARGGLLGNFSTFLARKGIRTKDAALRYLRANPELLSQASNPNLLAGPTEVTPARAEALSAAEANLPEHGTFAESTEPAAQVAGQATPPPPSTRWCVVCKRAISTRGGAWSAHIKSRPHKNMLARGTELMRGGYRDAGISEPQGFAEFFRKRVEDSIQVPPPVLGRAASDVKDLSPDDLRLLKQIAGTEGGRRSLLSAEPPWTPEQINEILGAEDARSGGGGRAVREEDDFEATPRRRPVLGRGGVATAVGIENFAGTTRQQRKEWAGVLDLVQDQRNFAREVLEENPVRALSVAIGQVLVNLTGRAELKNTVGDIGRTATEVSQLADDAKDVRERYVAAWEGLATPDLDEDTRDALQRTVDELGGEDGKSGVFGEIAKQFEEVAGVSLERFQEVAKLKPRERRAATRALEREALARETEAGLGEGEAPETLLAQSARLRQARPGIAIRTALNATVGIVGGTALFTAAMTAFNAAMEQGAQWVGRMTEEMSGFAAQANALAASLAQGALPTGRIEGGIRERLGMSGIGGAGADQLVDLIGPRITGEVAAQRSVMMRDTLALGLQQMQTQARFPGITNFAGNFQPTGGMVLPLIGQTNIGAQPSVQETIAGLVGGMPSTTPWDMLMDPTTDPLRGVRDYFSEGATTRDANVQQQFADAVTGSLTNALQRGGNRNEFVSGQGLDMSALKEQAALLLEAGGSPDLANRIQSGDIALVNAQGDVITSAAAVADAFDDLATGLQSVDLEQLLKSGARQMEATFFGIATNTQNQLQTWNPIQTAMQLTAAPPTAFGAGVIQSALPGGMFSERSAQSAAMRQQLEARQMRGFGQLLGQATGGNPFAMFHTNAAGFKPIEMLRTFHQIHSLGQQIVADQNAIATMQMDQQVAEYNRQVFVAERNISDLRGLVEGVGDAHEGNIGILQRENLIRQRRIQDIQREGEAESLAMNQRQINFRLAVAGFTSSGATPAEAAAQMKQAQMEAEFAQRQQDRQEEVFDLTGEMIPNERKIVDEQNLRALQDAIAEFGLFQDRFTLDQKTALMAQSIADAQALQSALSADMQTMLGSLQQVQSTEVQAVQDAFMRGSETLADTAEAVKGVYEDVANSFARSFDITISGTRTGSTDSARPRVGAGGTSAGAASGALFNTSGEMQLTVGEAGTETVAVLRNPRRIMGGGGGTNVQINFNGTVVRDDADIERLARRVEQIFQRRTSVLGYRLA